MRILSLLFDLLQNAACCCHQHLGLELTGVSTVTSLCGYLNWGLQRVFLFGCELAQCVWYVYRSWLIQRFPFTIGFLGSGG